jgi:hypothetical protein
VNLPAKPAFVPKRLARYATNTVENRGMSEAASPRSSRPFGYKLTDAGEFLRTNIIMVGLLAYALLGPGGDQLVRALGRHALKWRPAFVVRTKGQGLCPWTPFRKGSGVAPGWLQQPRA